MHRNLNHPVFLVVVAAAVVLALHFNIIKECLSAKQESIRAGEILGFKSKSC